MKKAAGYRVHKKPSFTDPAAFVFLRDFVLEPPSDIGRTL